MIREGSGFCERQQAFMSALLSFSDRFLTNGVEQVIVPLDRLMNSLSSGSIC